MSIIYAMYFSGKESNAISIDDPNVTVYCRVQNFNEKKHKSLFGYSPIKNSKLWRSGK
ncbi:DEHA2B16588p [Debaryomyces hansenii CBS767]|uniref:DEHA2B16588p n=1 Tax=Debaryomyces hansenii (strain ATCC 36239 / CBS 767 / BCRC 21394 / JCM 1990 / NBRC 0083 / IGC 2968) TaxID=284592 RepID=Q6BVU6_DEBHA|nr:DEHA2B16588p [Debaryomyces hansenii CBS767]CAG85687.1 DEHA2B16588p [Debaryomyces hansenii CBS767]|eukprot:XP_457673.1 DEHA2B16588p [Debaryomyces hansenii CBS767]